VFVVARAVTHHPAANRGNRIEVLAFVYNILHCLFAIRIARVLISGWCFIITAIPARGVYKNRAFYKLHATIKVTMGENVSANALATNVGQTGIFETIFFVTGWHGFAAYSRHFFGRGISGTAIRPKGADRPSVFPPQRAEVEDVVPVCIRVL